MKSSKYLKNVLIVITFLMLAATACEPRTLDNEITGDVGVVQNTEDISTKATSTPLAETLTPVPTLSPTVTFTSTPSVWLVMKSNANVRTGPGLGYQPTAVMKMGERVQAYMLNEDQSWLMIDPENQLWVHNSVVNIEGEITSLAIAPTPLPTSTRTAVPSKTPLPSATSVPAVSLDAIYTKLQSMTALQYKEYSQSIVGKPVREEVKVGNVDEKGRVIISGRWSPFIFNVSEFCVVVVGAPKNIAKDLNGGEKIFLEAKIDRIVDDYNYFINCEYTLVLAYKNIKDR